MSTYTDDPYKRVDEALKSLDDCINALVEERERNAEQMQKILSAMIIARKRLRHA